MTKRKRQTENVRQYLNSLADNPGDKKAEDTIQAVSREHDVAVMKLRKFRDGDDSALPSIVINTWNKLLGQDGSIVPGSVVNADNQHIFQSDFLAEQQERSGKFDIFDKMDATRPEFSAACSAWSDIMVTG